MSSLKVGLLVLMVLGGLMFLLKKRRAGSKPSLLEAPSVPGLPAPAGVQVTLSGEEAAAALPPVPGVQPVLTLHDLKRPCAIFGIPPSETVEKTPAPGVMLNSFQHLV